MLASDCFYRKCLHVALGLVSQTPCHPAYPTPCAFVGSSLCSLHSPSVLPSPFPSLVKSKTKTNKPTKTIFENPDSCLLHLWWQWWFLRGILVPTEWLPSCLCAFAVPSSSPTQPSPDSSGTIFTNSSGLPTYGVCPNVHINCLSPTWSLVGMSTSKVQK